MIRSAPSRFEAITPHRPTAPSPTTATVLPGPTCAASAAWWPVPITSVSASSDGISALSASTGSATSVPSACGTRTASPCPPSTSAKPYLPPCRHSLCSPSRQKTQLPSDHRNGETTRSPALMVATSDPTASTTPMNSCPIRRPASSCGIDLYGHRSLPQIAARVTRTSASVDSISRASGTSSTRTSPAPYITVARMGRCLRSEEEAERARRLIVQCGSHIPCVSHDRTGTPDLTDPAIGLSVVALTDARLELPSLQWTQSAKSRSSSPLGEAGSRRRRLASAPSAAARDAFPACAARRSPRSPA